MTALRSSLDRKEFIAYEQLWEDIKSLLTTYIMGLPMRDILHQKAQVTMNLLHTLVINQQIFELVTTKRMQLPSQAELKSGTGIQATVIGGLVDKEEEEDVAAAVAEAEAKVEDAEQKQDHSQPKEADEKLDE